MMCQLILDIPADVSWVEVVHALENALDAEQGITIRLPSSYAFDAELLAIGGEGLHPDYMGVPD